MRDEELSDEALTPRERVVFVATCQLAERESDDERELLFLDDDYVAEAERLAELRWLERVEHEGELAGYRLSSWAIGDRQHGDLNADGELTQTNLIMPEPTPFLDRKFPIVSIIRPTQTEGAAMGAVRAFTADGLFIGQSPEFFAVLQDLAKAADAARHGGHGH